MRRGTGFVVRIALALALAMTVSLAGQTVPVSRTAVLAASLRAIGSKHPDPAFRNPDRLAIEFIGARERALLTEFPVDALDLNYAEALARLSPQDRASVTSMFLRTKHLDAALDEAVRVGTRQVIILGAGFDSRGYRFRDRLRDVRVIEVDAGPTQDYKKQRVRDVVGDLPASVRYVPMDFTKDDLLTELAKAGYSRTERSLYIWEGVTVYLPEAAITSTLHFIRDHAAPGSRVVFDYTLASDPRINDRSTRFTRFGEPWVFGFPGTSAVDFLRRAGLDVVTDLSYAELAAMYARGSDGASPLPSLAGDQQARRIAVAEVPPTLITVTSKDGTRIGVECTGTGPTLLFVHGGVGDRTRWTPMFPLLAKTFTTCAMDRRGRGASGDSPEYSLSKEAEDVAAVVNSRPGPVFVFGHSYGGVAALEAAFVTDRIDKLMLYEPPLHEPVGNNLAAATKVEDLIKKGELEQAFITFQTEIVKQSPEEIARMKARPTWTGLVATIAVHPRQMRALSAYRFDANRMKSVRMPTLLLIGEDTPSPYAKQSIGALRELLPNPTLAVLERQEHNAMDGGREVLANAIIKFAATQK